MKTIVCICDKCRQPKQENEVAELKASITLPNGFTKYSNYNRTISTQNAKHICLECLQSIGLFTVKTEGDKEIHQPEQTIKDRLYDVMNDILSDLGVVFHE